MSGFAVNVKSSESNDVMVGLCGTIRVAWRPESKQVAITCGNHV